MKKTIYLLATVLFLSISGGLQAQQSGKVEFEQLGIAFTIPEGWVGQEGEGVYLMGSNTVPGFVLLIPQTYPDMDAMKSDIQAGYSDATGTSLRPSGSIETLSANAIGVEYNGAIEGRPAKAYLIGVLNPHGQEVGIMAATTVNQYSEAQPQVARQVWQSLEFAKPKTGPIVEKWKYELSNVKLTYMDSYYSPSYSDGGISGGYESKKVFDLCKAGYFHYYGSDNTALGGDYASGYSAGSSRGSGSWDVIANAAGQPVLQLKFNGGEVWEYRIEMKDKKLFLNGDRYYRTWSGEYAPSCN